MLVPNSLFSTIIVENPSRMTNRQISETLGIRYCDQDKMRVIVEDIKALVEGHDEVDTDQTIIVNFNEMSPSSLDIMLYFFTKEKAWVPYHKIKQDIMMDILDIVRAHGAEVAFPTSTVHLNEQVNIEA